MAPDLLASSASPLKPAWISSGRCTSRSAARIAAIASPMEMPGGVSNEMVAEGNWSSCTSHIGACTRNGRTMLASGTCAPDVPGT